MLFASSDCTVSIYVNKKDFMHFNFITAHDFDFPIERMQLTYTMQITVVDGFNFHLWQPFNEQDRAKYNNYWDDLGRFKTVKKDHESKPCFDSLLDYENH
jgi:hypothetical protein